MAVDFGIDIQLIPENTIKKHIDDFANCLEKSGLLIEIDLEKPGIGPLIHATIRGMEKALTASFEPMIALIKVAQEAIKKGTKAPAEFLKKVITLQKAITELLAKLPTSILEFILNKLFKPISDNLIIPIPNINGIIELILAGFDLTKVTWEEWLTKGKVILSEKFKKLSEKIKEQVAILFKIPNDANGKPTPLLTPFMKFFEVVLIPIKLAIDLIKKVIDIVKTAATNIFKTLKIISELAKNPVQFVLDLIKELLGNVISTIASKFAPPGTNTKNIANGVLEFFNFIFKLKVPTITEQYFINLAKKYPGIESIKPFLIFIKCMISWFINFLKPATLLGMFFSGNAVPSQPRINVKTYNITTRKAVLDDQAKSIVFTEAFDKNDKVQFYHTKRKKYYTLYVEKIDKTGIFLKKNVLKKVDSKDLINGFVKKL